MKKMLIVILLFIGIGVSITTITFYGATSLSFLAEGYCKTIASEDYKQSFYQLSNGFQKDIKLWDYKEYIKLTPMNDYKSVSWKYQRQDKKAGVLRGHIQTKKGRRYPIEFNFIHENKRWRIDSLIVNKHDVRSELHNLKLQSEHGTVQDLR